MIWNTPTSNTSHQNRIFSVDLFSKKSEEMVIFYNDDSVSFWNYNLNFHTIQIFILEILFDTDKKLLFSEIADELWKTEALIKRQFELVIEKLEKLITDSSHSTSIIEYLQSKLKEEWDSEDLWSVDANIDRISSNVVWIEQISIKDMIFWENNIIKYCSIEIKVSPLEYKLLNKVLGIPDNSFLYQWKKNIKVNNGNNFFYQKNPEFFDASLADSINMKFNKYWISLGLRFNDISRGFSIIK